MKKKNKSDNIFHVFSNVFLALLFSATVFFFLNEQTESLKTGYLNGVSKNSKYLLENVSSQLSSFSSEDEAIDYLSNSPTSATHYLFLLSDNSLVFEKDNSTTDKIGGLSFDELKSYYNSNSGDGVDELLDLIQKGETFSAVVTKDTSFGRELVTTDFVEIAGDEYCVGVGIQESYLLSVGKITERIFFLRIMLAIVCGVLISMVAYFSFLVRIKSHQINALKSEIDNKNMLVQEQSEVLFREPISDSEGIIDEVTGLYNRQFFETLIEKLAKKNAENVGIIFVEINNIREITNLKGFDFIDKLYKNTADSLKSFATDRDVCCRISREVFAVVSVSVTNDDLIDTAREVVLYLKQTNSLKNFSSNVFFYPNTTEIDLEMLFKNEFAHHENNSEGSFLSI